MASAGNSPTDAPDSSHPTMVRPDQTNAMFNSFYIGGIAHELGLGLGLPHHAQSPIESLIIGTSLMGSGNLTYKQNLRDPKKRGSSLTLVDAIRLASHPLFTGSHAGRFDKAGGRFSELIATADGDNLTIKGTISAQTPAYSLLSYVAPDGRSDYNARTFVAPVKEDGTFELNDFPIPKDPTKLRLIACHMNGETSRIQSDIPRAELTGQIDIEKLNASLSQTKK
jgi:hypothetical protein